MLYKRNGIVENNTPENYAYRNKKSAISKLALSLTRRLRAKNAMKFIECDGELLDVGCGDGYFLRKAPVTNAVGFDLLLNDSLQSLRDFEDHRFSYITLLAVIEHLDDPGILNSHLWRILKPGGKLIVTTPKKTAERLIKIYAPGIEAEHKMYFDLHKMRELLNNKYTLVDTKTFLFGLNQVFCFKRLP